MNFKPTKYKLTFTILVIFLGLVAALAYLTGGGCWGRLPEHCIDYEMWAPKNSGCDRDSSSECYPLYMTILHWVKFLIPGIVLYIIYSLAEKRKNSNKTDSNIVY